MSQTIQEISKKFAVSETKLTELVHKAHLYKRKFTGTLNDARNPVLNGNGFSGKLTEAKARERNALNRAMAEVFKSEQQEA